MRHAFLILAHNNFSSLQRLVSQLDFADNDIYIHIDAKCGRMPSLTATKAGLRFTDERIDVRWGDLSVVMAEYVLFETAYRNGPYARFHLLSGVDFCLKSQEQIHSFFDSYPDKEFIGYTLLESTPELVRKACRWHLFPGSFRSAGFIKKALRHAFLRLQELTGMHRNRGIGFKKGSQWVSVTTAMTELFISKKDWVIKTFSHTFCPDEIVFQTLCWDSPLRDNVFSTNDDAHGCMRAISWHDGEIKSWNAADIARLGNTEFMFARKHTQAATVSILIPVCNAEKTISRTLDSILAQDYPHIQVCIVNDCSTDGTESILNDYISKFESKSFQICIKRHHVNKGVAAGRNSLLEMATSDYIMFVDADDTLACNAVSLAVSLAEEKNSDITGWDWALAGNDGTRRMRQPQAGSPEEALRCMMAGTMRWNLWLFMLRRDLTEGFSFTPGMDMGEDMMCMLTLMSHASAFSQIQNPLYTYIQTNSSISRTMTPDNIRQVTGNFNAVEVLFRKEAPYGVPMRYLEFLKLDIKLPLLVSQDKRDYLCWSEWFSEADRYILLNRRIPYRTRLLQAMAWFRLWPAVSMYNKLVYGKAYRLMFNKEK